MANPRQNPFPGMNPYLEAEWPGVHNALVTYIRDALSEGLPDGLLPRLDQRVFVEAFDTVDRVVRPDVYVYQARRLPVPESTGGVAVATLAPPVAKPILIDVVDTEVVETFIELIDARSGGRVITTIEVVSPSNKAGGKGREQYLERRQAAMAAGVHVVEIDLLRAGRPLTLAAPDIVPRTARSPYHAVVSRATRRQRFEYYSMPLRQPLPSIGIPLRASDDDVVVSLQPLLDRAYMMGRYADEIDYAHPPEPAFDGDEAAWVRQVLTEAGLASPTA